MNNSENKLVANITDLDLSCVNQELAYNPVNQDMYLTAGHSLTTVYLISSTNNTVIGAIKGFSSPEGIAYDPSDRMMYVVNNGNGTVQTISGTVVLARAFCSVFGWRMEQNQLRKCLIAR